MLNSTAASYRLMNPTMLVSPSAQRLSDLSAENLYRMSQGSPSPQPDPMVNNDEMHNEHREKDCPPASEKSENNRSDSVERKMQMAPVFCDTVQELRCDQIRWFYAHPSTSKKKSTEDLKNDTNDVTATNKSPTRELKQKTSYRWTPFRGRDSLRLEIAYRYRYDISVDERMKNDVMTYHEKTLCGQGVVTEQGEVLVLDQLYLANIETMRGRPIYWQPQQDMVLLRGTWFTKDGLQPLQTELADKIEAKHLQVFYGQRQPTLPIDLNIGSRKPVLASVSSIGNGEVRWHSVVDVAVHLTGVRGTLWAFVPLVKKSTALVRGYKQLALATDADRDVEHLVFVVPGIGQKWNKSAIITKVGEFRDLIDKYYHLYYEHGTTNRRVMVVPIEWRHMLRLDGNRIQSLTIKDFEQWRVMFNRTVMDIMYYTSPLYRSEIFEGVVSLLNRQYATFLSHNPQFLQTGGKVSIIGHSLGSVIAYDIITHLTPGKIVEDILQHEINIAQKQKLNDTAWQLEEVSHTLRKLHDNLHEPKSGLKFKVDSLFCIGSPLGVFLQMREQYDNILPSSIRRLHNIFHPVDVVAYRLEPLIDRRYRRLIPLRVHWADQHYKAPRYEYMSAQITPHSTVHTDDAQRQRIDSDISDDSPVSFFEPFEAFACTISDDELTSSQNEQRAKVHRRLSRNKNAKGINNTSTAEDAEEFLKKIPVERRLRYRLDYVLPQYRTEVNAISAIWAHYCYWNSDETATYILQALYSDTIDNSANVQVNR